MQRNLSTHRGLNALLAALVMLALLGGLFAPQAARAATPTDLFFSEYVEGSSFNKALEIYNGTGAAVDLAAGQYVVQMYFNGSSSVGLTITLSDAANDIIANGDVFVIAPGTTSSPPPDAAIIAQADLITTSTSWFNGDDAVVLRKGGAAGPIVDVIGQVGLDPGTEWVGGGANDTLRRLATVCAGDTNPSDEFTFATEWETFASDTFGGLGSHTANCDGTTTPTVNLSISTNSTSEAAQTVVTVTATASSVVSGDQTVSLGVSGTGITAGDYLLSNTTITILGGLTTGSVTFTVVDDTDVEGTETATLTISSPSAGITLGTTISQNITIADNDNAPTPVCEQPFTPIYAIQGSGASAAITGNVTTQGVVVGDYEGANEVGIGGFYLQDPTGDGVATTSDGIFVFTGTAPGVNTVQAGDVVRVTGFARERFNETALNGSNSNSAAVPTANIVDCGTGSVAPTPVNLPVADGTFLERYEGMLITLPQSLVISEYFNYDRFGEYVLALPLSGENRPYTPTSIEVPGSPAYFSRLDLNLRSRILIDDGLGSQNPAGGNTHPNGLPFSLANSFRGGDTVTGFTGVLGFGFSNYRVQPTTYGTYTAVNPRPASPEPVGGTLKVAAFNTLNYFLTLDPLDDGTGSNDNPADNICGPVGNTQDCRGADLSQPDELTRQRAKLLATLSGLNADVIGLIELENTTGVEPMADIVAGLPGYDFVDTGVIGSDTIKVGIIYRTAAVQPVGDPAVLDAPAFVNPFNATTDRNRPAVAQTFEEIATGARFTVVVNHLKSKGSGCGAGDDDTTNGQGNCNGTRTAAVEALLDWLATDPTGSGDPDFLIVGDLNSYAKEDPIVALENAGYTNLIAQFGGPLAYSYAFDGQFGYLDYAMSSASLTPQITGMTEWHINADEPDLIDYDTSFKSAVQDGYFAPDAFRSADHDPVLVGLGLKPEAGSIKITKVVNLDGLTPPAEQFTICVTGPSYPNGDCKQVGTSGGTLSWSRVKPGNYSLVEQYAGDEWSVTYSTQQVNVVAGPTPAEATITNKLCCLYATDINLTRSGSRINGVVTVTYSDGYKPSNVAVTVKWTRPNGTTVTQTVRTGEGGVARFSIPRRAGTMTLEVINISDAPNGVTTFCPERGVTMASLRT